MMAVSLPCHACTEHCGLMQRNDDEERRVLIFLDLRKKGLDQILKGSSMVEVESSVASGPVTVTLENLEKLFQ